MRRRLERYLPIVLVAVLVQLIAPLGALQVVARSVSDPLVMASICSGMSDEGHATPDGGTMNHDCCTVCGAGLTGMPVLDPPPSVFVVLQRAYQRVAWLAPADVLPATDAGSHAQARAPPVLS